MVEKYCKALNNLINFNMKKIFRPAVGNEEPVYHDEEYYKVRDILVAEAESMIESIDCGQAYVGNNPGRHRKEYQAIVDCFKVLGQGGQWDSFSLGHYLLVMNFLMDQYKLMPYYVALNSGNYSQAQLNSMYTISRRVGSGVYNACEMAGIPIKTAQRQILGMATEVRKSNWLYSILAKK